MTGELSSWRDGRAKQAVLDFVASATQAGPGFIPAADRIAAFDNDGTLWVEQPLPPQFDFQFHKWIAEVKADPALANQQPYKAVLEQDAAFFARIMEQDPQAVEAVLQAFARSWSGSTPEEFDAEVRDWITTATQPKVGVPYVKLVYRPMRELIDYLKANDFRVFVCSGGGRDFMRVFAEETWGLYKENVIGSAPAVRYEGGRIVRAEEIVGGLDLGPGKPEHIFAQTGRLPAFAAGNSDADIEMLESAAFALLVNHDDAEREFAYKRGAEQSVIHAENNGWTVVSVRDDWDTVFTG